MSFYRWNGKDIDEWFESTEGRQKLTLTSNFYVQKNGEKKHLEYAEYDKTYHPFFHSADENKFFKNFGTSEIYNKQFIHKGGYPKLIERFGFSQNDIYEASLGFLYKGTGSPFENGTLSVKITVYSSSTDTQGTTYTQKISDACPSTLIMAVVGAGGGGASGPGDNRSFGGGCGAVAFFNIEMPYNHTSETEFMRINLFAGGTGGGQKIWVNGQDGNGSVVMFGGYLVAGIKGGRGGGIVSNHYDPPAPTEPAITTIDFYQNLDTQTFSLGEGEGKIAINESCKTFTAVGLSGKKYPYMPGSYVSLDENSEYAQQDNDSTLITPLETIQSQNKGTLTCWTGDDMIQSWDGNCSLFGKGGQNGETKGGGAWCYAGGDGEWGAGGGAGSAGSSFNGSGGKGGSAGLKLYW